MNLIRRSLIAASMVAVGICSSPSVHASILKPTHTMFSSSNSKVKTISLTLRNDTGAPIELRAGDSVMKLESGGKMSVKLPVGTRILAGTETHKLKPGELVVEVSSELNGGTVIIN
jgi:hypothetical protein